MQGAVVNFSYGVYTIVKVLQKFVFLVLKLVVN